ncbi:MAG TPA: type II toxin-antitoxin system prevent-host-death family antitoxin [Thermoanaerobaculia bacterium]
MKRVNLDYAETHLSRLVGEALAGEEVVIAREGVPLVRLEPLAAPKPRVFGKDAGKVVLSEDFNDPLPDLEALFYGVTDDPA